MKCPVKLTVLFSTLLFDHEDWVAINDVSGTYRGEIYLEMTFFASGPQPQSQPQSLARRPSKLPPQERLQHLKKPGLAPSAGGKLTVPGSAQVYEPLKMDKPLPSVHESPGPAPLPSILRPGTGHVVNGHGRRSSEYTSPINSPPPSSLFPGRPPTSPVQQPNNSNAFRIPGQHSRTSSGSGYDLPYSASRPNNSPPRSSYSPPRQSTYALDPAPQSDSRAGFFPSPQIVVDTTPPAPEHFNRYNSESSYSSPQPSPPRHTPPQFPPSSGAPGFPSLPSQQAFQSFPPSQSTSLPYPPPQSNYPPQSGYPQPQSTYPPPPQPGYPMQGPPQFPSNYPTFYTPHQDPYQTYEHTSPPPGPGHPPFFGRRDSVGDFPDPALAQRYSSPLPLPNNRNSPRSSSPFPVPATVPPSQHPVPTPFSPSAEYERQLQSRREQEERDEEFARQLDIELNLGTGGQPPSGYGHL